MNVTIAAAFAAGMLSFLSPCVLPLVPPYLVYLTGTSLERLPMRKPEPRVAARRSSAALLFVLGFSTVFVALGASASAIGAVLRAYSGELAIVAGVVIIVMGLHFLGLTPIALADAREAHRGRQAGRPVGRLSDGARVRARLDALHRADPRRDPGGGGVGGDRRQRRRHARGLFAGARHSVSGRGASRSSRSPPSSPAFAPISAWWRRRWAGCWCSPASPSSPAR